MFLEILQNLQKKEANKAAGLQAETLFLTNSFKNTIL